MSKKKKEKYYKPIDNNVGMLRPNVALQMPVANAISTEKKIPKDIFVKNEKPVKKKKVPKGSHRMPDGTIMKDSDMKKKSNKTKNETKLNKGNRKSSSSY